MTYYEICENIATKGWTEVWDDDIKAPYAYGTDDGLDQWIGYDNPASIEYKVRMAKDYDLGAIMWWSIDNDDFKGQFCGQGPYPLLNASKREWNRPGGNGGSNPTQGPTSGPTSAHTTKPVTTKVTTTKPPQNGCTDNVLYPHADSCQKYYQCANSQLVSFFLVLRSFSIIFIVKISEISLKGRCSNILESHGSILVKRDNPHKLRKVF